MTPVRKRRRDKAAPPRDGPPPVDYRTPSSLDDYQAWADYAKEPSQRSDAPLPGLAGPGERYAHEVAVSAASGPVADAEVDEAVNTGYAAPHGDLGRNKFAGRPSRLDTDDRATGRPEYAAPPGGGSAVEDPHFYPSDARGVAGYDVALYVLSGLMIILVLEQFVQMGVALRA